MEMFTESMNLSVLSKKQSKVVHGQSAYTYNNLCYQINREHKDNIELPLKALLY